MPFSFLFWEIEFIYWDQLWDDVIFHYWEVKDKEKENVMVQVSAGWVKNGQKLWQESTREKFSFWETIEVSENVKPPDALQSRF